MGVRRESSTTGRFHGIRCDEGWIFHAESAANSYKRLIILPYRGADVAYSAQRPAEKEKEALEICQSHAEQAQADAQTEERTYRSAAAAFSDALSRARRTQMQMDTALRANAERQLERKQYAAALAERQFNKVDPDNRLVAAELERRWEAALNEVREAEVALAQQTSPQTIAHMGILHDKVVSLAGRLPQIWADPTTTDAQRKALLRCLIDKVVLDRGDHDVASARVVWLGGAVTNLEVKMKVNSIAMLTRGMEMRDRALDLARDGMPDVQIASVLTSEGHRSPNCKGNVLPITVYRIRHAAGIPVSKPHSRWSHELELAHRARAGRQAEHPGELALCTESGRSGSW